MLPVPLRYLFAHSLALPLWKAVPNVYSPNEANKLKPMGSGLPDLIARGIELPARTIEARRASSTPYVLRFWMRRPPKMYCYNVSCMCVVGAVFGRSTRRPTVTPAAIEGTDPVRM